MCVWLCVCACMCVCSCWAGNAPPRRAHGKPCGAIAPAAVERRAPPRRAPRSAPRAVQRRRAAAPAAPPRPQNHPRRHSTPAHTETTQHTLRAARTRRAARSLNGSAQQSRKFFAVTTAATRTWAAATRARTRRPGSATKQRNARDAAVGGDVPVCRTTCARSGGSLPGMRWRWNAAMSSSASATALCGVTAAWCAPTESSSGLNWASMLRLYLGTGAGMRTRAWCGQDR